MADFSGLLTGTKTSAPASGNAPPSSFGGLLTGIKSTGYRPSPTPQSFDINKVTDPLELRNALAKGLITKDQFLQKFADLGEGATKLTGGLTAKNIIGGIGQGIKQTTYDIPKGVVQGAEYGLMGNKLLQGQQKESDVETQNIQNIKDLQNQGKISPLVARIMIAKLGSEAGQPDITNNKGAMTVQTPASQEVGVATNPRNILASGANTVLMLGAPELKGLPLAGRLAAGGGLGFAGGFVGGLGGEKANYGSAIKQGLIQAGLGAALGFSAGGEKLNFAPEKTSVLNQSALGEAITRAKSPLPTPPSALDKHIVPGLEPLAQRASSKNSSFVDMVTNEKANGLLPKAIKPGDIKESYAFGSSIVKGAHPNDVDVAVVLSKDHPLLKGNVSNPGGSYINGIHYSFFADTPTGRNLMDSFINKDKAGAPRPAIKIDNLDQFYKGATTPSLSAEVARPSTSTSVERPTQGGGEVVQKANTPGPGEGLRAGPERINKAIGTDLQPSTYTKRSQAVLQANSEKAAATNLDALTGRVQKALSQAPGRLTDQQLSDAYTAAQKHLESGNTELGNKILRDTLPHDTATAQALAARGMLTKASPLGIQKMVVGALDKAKVPLEGDLKAKIDAHMAEIKSTATGSAERESAVRKLANTVTQAIPRSTGRAAAEFWRAMLISGPQTAVKVAISQPISAAQAYLKQYPAGALDAIRSFITGGPRTTAIAPFKGIGSGLKEGFQAAATKLKSGVDVPGTGGFTRPIEQQLATGAHQTVAERTIFNLHGAIQKPVDVAIRNNTLAQLGKAEAINQGLKGAERRAFIDNYIKSPPQEAYQHAIQAGEEAVNQQKTKLGELAGSIQKAGGKNGGPGPGIVVAPITRVPGAIATNALYNYSGLKLAKTAIVDGLIKHGSTPNFSRTIAEDFGKAVVGAGGVSALGAVLGATGNITPAKFANSKEAALAKAEGKPAGSVHLPGTKTWISVNAMGPVGIELATGGGFGRGYKKEGVIGGAEQGLASGGEELARQPYVQGITGIGNALNNPKQYAKSFVNNLVGSVVPAAVSQTAIGTDPSQRQINYGSAKDVLKSRIPGVRETISPSYDVLGGQLPGPNASRSILGGIAGTLDALKPSTGRANDVTKELGRLAQAGVDATPSPLKAQQLVGKKSFTLNDKQLAELQRDEGVYINNAFQKIIGTSGYQKAPDEVKQQILQETATRIRSIMKLKYILQNRPQLR